MPIVFSHRGGPPGRGEPPAKGAPTPASAPGAPEPAPAAPELLAPPMGLFNTRIARATFAVYANSRDMGAIEPGDTVRFVPFAELLS